MEAAAQRKTDGDKWPVAYYSGAGMGDRRHGQKGGHLPSAPWTGLEKIMIFSKKSKTSI